jgi:hypothetical protein
MRSSSLQDVIQELSKQLTKSEVGLQHNEISRIFLLSSWRDEFTDSSRLLYLLLFLLLLLLPLFLLSPSFSFSLFPLSLSTEVCPLSSIYERTGFLIHLFPLAQASHRLVPAKIISPTL